MRHISLQRASGIKVLAVLTLLLALAPATPADAYIDAGTGGLIVQLLLAGLAGLGVVIKMYWRKVTEYFTRREK